MDEENLPVAARDKSNCITLAKKKYVDNGSMTLMEFQEEVQDMEKIKFTSIK